MHLYYILYLMASFTCFHSVPDEQRKILGIDDTLIRLSVGIESCRDLVDDLDGALHAALMIME